MAKKFTQFREQTHKNGWFIFSAVPSRHKWRLWWPEFFRVGWECPSGAFGHQQKHFHLLVLAAVCGAYVIDLSAGPSAYCNLFCHTTLWIIQVSHLFMQVIYKACQLIWSNCMSVETKQGNKWLIISFQIRSVTLLQRAETLVLFARTKSSPFPCHPIIQLCQQMSGVWALSGFHQVVTLPSCSIETRSHVMHTCLLEKGQGESVEMVPIASS